VLPDLTVIPVIVAILMLVAVFDRVLFKPLTRVMRERESAVKSAVQMADTAAARAQAASAELDARVAAARADTYRQMDDRRRAAQDYRTELIGQTRTEIETTLAAARATLESHTTEARTTLEHDAAAIGDEIARKILGRS
jgi:F-type H+-transporting ATPase subunit b